MHLLEDNFLKLKTKNHYAPDNSSVCECLFYWDIEYFPGTFSFIGMCLSYVCVYWRDGNMCHEKWVHIIVRIDKNTFSMEFWPQQDFSLLAIKPGEWNEHNLRETNCLNPNKQC